LKAIYEGSTHGIFLTGRKNLLAKGGLNFGTIGSSVVLAFLLVAFVIYTRRREMRALNQELPLSSNWVLAPR
jgi:uncharacterized membrane-anchored protein